MEHWSNVSISSGMGVRRGKRSKSGDNMTCSWDVHGKPQDHERLVEKLLACADVKEFQA